MDIILTACSGLVCVNMVAKKFWNIFEKSFSKPLDKLDKPCYNCKLHYNRLHYGVL